ncbi:MAG TPA: MFS transporter, partial [Rhodobiaceae bacterium]|nr:MFS transporter [Rhodobiaceae bacterium]
TLPAIVMLASAAVMWNFPLDREAQLDLRKKIQERDGVHASHDASEAAAAVTQVGTAGGMAE